MRLSIFGIWIAFISIVKCQTRQVTDCYDTLSKVTVEVSPFIQALICVDNSPETIVIDSDHGFWYGNVEGFCTSSILNIGSAEMDYLISAPSLTIQLIKNSQTLDAATIQVSLDSQTSDTHFITVWGHQDTRFVLKVMRHCAIIQVPDNKVTTPVPMTTFQTVTGIALPTTTPKVPRTTTLETDRDNNSLDSTTQQQTTEIPENCSTFTITEEGIIKCVESTSETEDKEILNKNVSTTSSVIRTTSTTQSSIEISKIDWMEQKRKEFEEKVESYRANATNVEELITESAEIFLKGTDAIEMVTPTIAILNTRLGDHTNILEEDFNSHSFPSSKASYDYNHIRPTVVISSEATAHRTVLVVDIKDPVTSIPGNIGILPSTPELSSTMSPSTEPAAFLPILGSTTTLPDSNSAILSPTSSLTRPETYLSSTEKPIYDKHSMKDSAVKSHDIPLHPSESSIFSSSIPNLPESTYIPSSYQETLVFSPAVHSSTYSTTTLPPTTPTPIPYHPPRTSNTSPSPSPSPSPKQHKVIMTTDNKIIILPDLEDDTKAPSTTENSTIPHRKTEEAGFQGETFWPVVAALVVGIPSVLVFGIAIVVIHRRRTPMARKIFAMRSFSNLSTPSSSLPGYTHFNKSKRDSSSQSSV